jgi:hypothetical protein
VDAMIYGGLARYSRETSLVFREAVDQWRRELRDRTPGMAGADVDIFSIEVNLSDIEDPDLRERVVAIPTAFRISEQDRALLRQAARVSLAQSVELRRFMQSMGSR